MIPKPKKLKHKTTIIPKSILKSFFEKMAYKVNPITIKRVIPAAVSTKGPP